MNSMLRHVNSYLDILRNTITDKSAPIEDIGICPCGYKKDNTPPALDEFKPYKNGEFWGDGNDTHAWFHFTINVPDEMKGNPNLELCIHTDRSGWDADNPQFLCYVDGVIRQGFDTNHRELALTDCKDSYDVYLYAYTGPRVAQTKLIPFIRTVHPEVVQYYYDVFVPREALDCMETNSMEYMEVLTALSMSLRELNVLEPRGEEYYESVKRADRYLHEHLYDKEKPSDKTVICIGHTHIDIAWLWTVGQTREKAQRSFATVIELMKRYPEYKFMSSQAYLYKAVKEEAPELYEEIKKMVKAGRWEVEGAMWVEADCNLTSGESLVRQVMYGKNFFRDEFGVESHILWLPDVFGYSAALPQILKKSGVDWFVTSKISWNDVNVMPYDVFSWQGIDGTRINTYFLTAQDKGRGTDFNKWTTYVAYTRPQMIAGSYNRFQQKELCRESMVTFGFGDGGGGPTADMIEEARRQYVGVEGLPNVRIEFAGDMLARLAKNIENNPRLPEWRGELYLEFHRGTYTSNARNKKNNRDCEFLMLDSEMLSVAAGLLAGREYPAGKLHGMWETMLVNQFHDIIPGSSIREVYEQCDREYAELRRDAAEIREGAQNSIVPMIKTDKNYIVFNPHSFIGNGVVCLDGKTHNVENVPSKGWKAVNLTAGNSSVKVDGRHVESRYYSVDFDENMELSRIYDKTNDREVLLAGETGNQLRIYEDYPDQYDAWEIQDFSNYKYYALKEYDSVSVADEGASVGITVTRHHGDSRIVQTVRFYDDNARIDFDTKLDWHSKHRILRTAFPIDVNTDKATFEVQFGTIERPTHMNTSWDRAKFETCAQKYADISEGNFGVSLLNNCKYGHDIHGNLMQLTLLKCPAWPNEIADEGAHSFTYSIMPHAGSLRDSDTLKEAYMLNFPMYTVKAASANNASLPDEWSLVSVDKQNIVIETVKQAEYDEDIIVRMYEAENFNSNANLTLGFKAKEIWLADLSENKLEKLAENTDKVRIKVKPFEIVTLRLVK